MIYSLSLETALLLIGLLLIASHTFALVQREKVQAWLKVFPRSSFAGIALIGIATAWFWWLVSTMDLGEFETWRRTLKLATPVIGVLTAMYVPEFLAVRALGMIVLLGAEVLLEAAWMRPEGARLWLVSLVYLWLTVALFWVGMPYTMRDQIAWISANRSRWQAASIGGIAYGAILLLSHVLIRHR